MHSYSLVIRWECSKCKLNVPMPPIQLSDGSRFDVGRPPANWVKLSDEIIFCPVCYGKFKKFLKEE